MKKNCKLLNTDIDSLSYEVTNYDIYQIMENNIDEYDTSDYSKNNIYKMPNIKRKIIGLIKNKCNGCYLNLLDFAVSCLVLILILKKVTHPRE